MSGAADPYSILNKDPNRGKITQQKKITVNRLWAGKVPEWAETNQNINQEKAHSKNISERKKFETEIIVESSPKNIPVNIIVNEYLTERYT